MKEKVIPILFQKYFVSRMYSDDFDDYELNSSPEVQRSLLDDLSEENAHKFFEGVASRIHESSHRDVFYYHNIRCNFLHIAIQLNDVSCVEKLLNEYNINPLEPLVYIYSKEQKDNDKDRELEKEEKVITISPFDLAKGREDILSLLNAATTGKKQIKADVLHDVKENPDALSDAGYETDIEETKKQKKYKSRLILGDGNLSYSRALLKKRMDAAQDDFAKSMTVTEYNTEDDLREIYQDPGTNTKFKNFEQNVTMLREMGAEVILGVDATALEDAFSERRFKRIHFNFPYYHDEALSANANKAKTRQLVGQFFSSAATIQQPGDRIHMGLVTGFRDPVWYENATYGVAEFCETYGYVYIAKRNFIDPAKGSRYPGYFHVKTSSGQTVNTADTGREFIFEKKIPGKQYEHSSQKKKTSHSVEHPVLKQRDTDSGTSSYENHSDHGAKIAVASSINTPDSAAKAKRKISVAASLKLGGVASSRAEKQDSSSEEDISSHLLKRK